MHNVWPLPHALVHLKETGNTSSMIMDILKAEKNKHE